MRFPDNILLGRIDAPRYTASNSGNIDKWCYFIPTKFAFQTDKILNETNKYNTK